MTVSGPFTNKKYTLLKRMIMNGELPSLRFQGNPFHVNEKIYVTYSIDVYEQNLFNQRSFAQDEEDAAAIKEKEKTGFWNKLFRIFG